MEAIAEPVILGEGTIASDYALKNLNAALGKAQIKFTPAVKDLKNAYGGYKYVPLENIINSSRPALAENHLTVMQFPASDLERKTVTLITRIAHWDSGEWIQNSLEVPAELALGKDGALKFNQQTIGGGVTYARKIAYKPILGVADSDDDIDAGQEQPMMAARPPKAAVSAREVDLEAERVNWLDAITEATETEFSGVVVPKLREGARQFIACGDGNLLTVLFNRLPKNQPELFSKVMRPMNTAAVEIGRKDFVRAVSAEATARGYIVNRATGDYEGKEAARA